MKKQRILFVYIVLFFLFTTSCGSNNTKSAEPVGDKPTETAEEGPGNTEIIKFDEVQVGSLILMTQNLNITKFRNGDPVPEAVSSNEWKQMGEKEQPAFCSYDNDPSNGEKYGKLYNWYAIADSRGLAPKGWHIATQEEWTILKDYLKGDLSSFKERFGGCRHFLSSYNFAGIESSGSWWSLTEYNYYTSYYYDSNYGLGSSKENGSKTNGLSVLCVKD